jgi:hypothetical protein
LLKAPRGLPYTLEQLDGVLGGNLHFKYDIKAVKDAGRSSEEKASAAVQI